MDVYHLFCFSRKKVFFLEMGVLGGLNDEKKVVFFPPMKKKTTFFSHRKNGDRTNCLPFVSRGFRLWTRRLGGEHEAHFQQKVVVSQKRCEKPHQQTPQTDERGRDREVVPDTASLSILFERRDPT